MEKNLIYKHIILLVTCQKKALLTYQQNQDSRNLAALPDIQIRLYHNQNIRYPTPKFVSGKTLVFRLIKQRY